MKNLITVIIALFSQLSLANEWRKINQNVQGYNIQMSYTSASSPATYGSEGGSHERIFYFEVFSQYAAVADSVEIFEVTTNGLRKVTTMRMIEDNNRHFYGKKEHAQTYGNLIWFNKNYQYKLTIDGKILQGKFKL